MYGLAMREVGIDMVHKYVGQEPSGHNYNELVLDGEGYDIYYIYSKF